MSNLIYNILTISDDADVLFYKQFFKHMIYLQLSIDVDAHTATENRTHQLHRWRAIRRAESQFIIIFIDKYLSTSESEHPLVSWMSINVVDTKSPKIDTRFSRYSINIYFFMVVNTTAGNEAFRGTAENQQQSMWEIGCS